MAETLIPPVEVAKNAARGLELRAKHRRGGTSIGVNRARTLSKREHISPETIKRMVSYFARHTVDKSAPHFEDDDDPSAGKIAWLLWGGDAGEKWAADVKRRLSGN